MAFQGKLRRRELFGSASVEWWPLFTQVVNASSPSHTRHNSFSSQSASQHRLSDCHCPWFITPVPATGAECHQASAILQSHYKALVSHPDPLLSSCLPQAYLLQQGNAEHTETHGGKDLSGTFIVTLLWLQQTCTVISLQASPRKTRTYSKLSLCRCLNRPYITQPACLVCLRFTFQQVTVQIIYIDHWYFPNK